MLSARFIIYEPHCVTLCLLSHVMKATAVTRKPIMNENDQISTLDDLADIKIT